jgi:hypothetical protein
MSQNGETEELDKAQPQDISVIAGPVNRLDNPTDQAQSTILHGQEAWHRLGRDHTWENWRHVGAALLIGRSGAMREAGVNRPVGRRYNVVFAAWLDKFGFENLDKADRSRLFAVMDHLPEIETWRATLTPAQRLRLNHPSAVFRKWQSANAISHNQNKKCREENSVQKQEVFGLRRERERFGGARWDPADRPEDIAIAIIAKLTRNKAAAVAGAILKALEGKVAECGFATDEFDQEAPLRNIGGEDAT